MTGHGRHGLLLEEGGNEGSSTLAESPPRAHRPRVAIGWGLVGDGGGECSGGTRWAIRAAAEPGATAARGSLSRRRATPEAHNRRRYGRSGRAPVRCGAPETSTREAEYIGDHDL